MLFAETVSGCAPWSGSLLIEESAVLKQEKFNKKNIQKYIVQKDNNHIMRLETRKRGQMNIYNNSCRQIHAFRKSSTERE
jgi:hypothetical protein